MNSNNEFTQEQKEKHEICHTDLIIKMYVDEWTLF